MQGRWIFSITTMIVLLVAAAATAQPGSALDFDGDDYVEVSDPIDLRDAFTVEAWIRPDAFDGGRFVSNRLTGGYEMDVVSGGMLRFTLNYTVRAQADISAHLGSWIHVAATWAGPVVGDIVIYVNGEIAATESSSDPIMDPAATLCIGRQPNSFNHFDGGIDEVRIFSAVLDQETIAVWSTRVIGAGHPYYAQLEAAWSFEEGSGQAVADSGGVGGRDGVLGSTPGADTTDPTWITSGMVAMEEMSFGELKALFR